MKFILQEDKFILTEGTKFLLEERFTLNEGLLFEAGATLANLKTAIKALSSLFPKVLKATEAGLSISILGGVPVRGTKEQVEKQIKDGCQTTQDLLSKKRNFKELLTKMAEKTKEQGETKGYSKEDLISIEPLCNRIEEDMNGVISKFSNLARGNGAPADQFNSLYEVLPRLNANIEKLYGLVDKPVDEKQPYKYKLTKEELTLKIGETYDLNSLVEVTPRKDIVPTFEFAATIATIDDKNVLTAETAGSGELKIKVDDQEFTCRVTITEATQYSLKPEKFELHPGDTLLLDIQANPKQDTPIKATFVSEDTKIATVDTEGKITAVAEGTTIIKATVADQTLTCDLTVTAEENAGEEIDTQTTADIDWKTKLASAVNKEAVIEEFIYTTWPEKAEEVIKIKAALLQECTSYGFLLTGPAANPFLDFISSVYLDAAYTIRPLTYNVLHNLVANDVLKLEDLTGNGEMQGGNLIFCKALYKLEDGAIKMYIHKQAELLKAALMNKSGVPKFASKGERAFAILYQIDTKKLESKGGKIDSSADMTLRSMPALEDLEYKWTGAVSSTAVAKTKAVTASEVLKQIKNTGDAVKVLVALAIKFSSNNSVNDLVRSCIEAQTLLSKNTTPDELQKLVASVEKTYKIHEITASKALQVINSILESERFDLTRKEKK